MASLRAMANNEPVPQYSIYDRFVPIEHVRVVSFVNPIGLEVIDSRKESEKTVAGCEGDRCAIGSREDANNG
jgi:hypothetical protein